MNVSINILARVPELIQAGMKETIIKWVKN